MLSTDDLQWMRQDQTSRMFDKCRIHSVVPGTANEFNEDDIPSEQVSDPISCGLEMKSGSEKPLVALTAIQYDAILRLPIGTPVKETDKIEIIERYGERPENLTFQVVSPIQQGPSAIRVLLRKDVI